MLTKELRECNEMSKWDEKIVEHLVLIEGSALVVARHARMLPFKPNRRTYAEEELREAKMALLKSLSDVDNALTDYASKPTGGGS